MGIIVEAGACQGGEASGAEKVVEDATDGLEILRGDMS